MTLYQQHKTNERVHFNQMPLVSSAVSISKSWLILSWKYETVRMAPVKMARSRYCENLSLRFSVVGGTTQYLRRVHSLCRALAFPAAGLVDSLKLRRSIYL